MNTSNVITIIIVVILVALAVGGYFYLQGRPEELVLVTEGTGFNENSQFLVLLRRLEGVTIDTSFFQNPLFRNLDDGVALPPIPPLGRVNPFSPLNP